MENEGTESDTKYAEEANGDGQPRKSSSSHESPPPTDLEEKATHVRFLLSNAEAGSVIGKGGSTINNFKVKSGARILLSRTFETFPGTSDRIVLVSGAFDDVFKAVDLIMSKLIDEFYAEEEDVDPHFKLKMIVPNGSCGGLIGKGGSTIKSYIEDSGAYIKVTPLDNNYPGLYDRLVIVNGNLGEQMRAFELILLKLTEDIQYTQSSALSPYVYAGSVQRYNGGQNGSNGIRGKFPNDGTHNKGHPQQEERSDSVVVGVPDEHIGLVLGRGGRNIADISQVSGARIRISDRGDFMSGTSNRKLTITGSQRSIHVAETMISEKLSTVRNR